MVFAFARPVEWGEAKLRFRLWEAGARPVLWEKYRGFTQDRCGGRPPADCECVWLIHGMGESVLTWRKIFLAPAPLGSLPVRLFAIDLPGHGGSLKRHHPAEYRVSNIAREIDAEIAMTSRCPLNALVGEDFGGWVAARLALLAPKRYARLVLIDPLGLKETESMTGGRFREGIASEIRAAQVVEDELDGRSGKIPVETLVIGVGKDPAVSPQALERFARGLPHAELVTLPDCGPFPQKECPEKFFPLLTRGLFLSHSAP
jgi:pimeloyl-ACP methyl ester carboxylesterase